MYAFSFIYNTATGIYNTANIGGLNFSCLFERAEIQIPVNRCECLQSLNFSPGNLFWGSFTSHNTGNYFRQGINVTTNERLSPTFRGNGNTIIVGDSQTSPLPIFPEGEGTSVHRLPKGGFVAYRDSFSYISLLLGRGVPFVIPRTSLHRGSLYRCSTVTSFVKLWLIKRQHFRHNPSSAFI